MTDDELDAHVKRFDAMRNRYAIGMVSVADAGVLSDVVDTITTLRAERDEATACNRGLVRLNEATQARADRAEAALKLFQSLDAISVAKVEEMQADLDRAEAERAAQIEADAGIADDYVKMRERQIADEKAKATHHVDVPQLMRWGAGKVQSENIAAAIRAQPHDRTALDRMLRAEREKALREAAGEMEDERAKQAILTLIERPAPEMPIGSGGKT